MSHPSSYSDIPRGPTPSDMSHSDLIVTNQDNVDTMSRAPDYTDTSKEVVYQPWNTDTAKEATAHSHANQYTLVPQQGGDGSNYHVAGAAAAPPPSKVPWYRRKRIWMPAMAVLLVIIAVVVGVIVGLKVGRGPSSDTTQDSSDESSSTSTADSDDSTSISACRGKTCGQTFSAAVLGDKLHMMATGDDKALWTRVHDGKDWQGEWTSLGNSFRGQPVSVTWMEDTRIDVWGVTASTNSIEFKTYMRGSWASSWQGTGGNTRYALAACHVQYRRERVDPWLRGLDRALYHDAIERDDEGDDTNPSFTRAGWQMASDGSRLGSAAAVVCRNDPTYHDVVYYNLTGRGVQHLQFSDEDGWSQSDRGGRFAGDPVLVSPTSSRVDFFGTGEDGAIHHFTWTNKDGYTDLESLGGDFESVPAVVATSSDRLDVVALGKDDKLKHRALIGSTWTSDWEDLGTFSNSAPFVVKFGSTPMRVGIFVLGADKDVMFATWEVTENGSWKEEISKFTSIGGKMGTTWLDGTE